MSRVKDDTNPKRRAFLKGSMVAGAGAAVVSTAPAIAATAPEITAEENKPADDGYKLSAHVLKYYQTVSS